MELQLVRFVESSNKDFQATHPIIHHPKSFPSLRIVNGITPSVTAVVPPRYFITSTPTTFNLSNETATAKRNKSSIYTPIHGTILNPSSSAVSVSMSKPGWNEMIPIANTYSNANNSTPQTTMLCENIKTSNSPSSSKTQRSVKRPEKESQTEERGLKSGKRCRNWTADETSTFIAIWTEYYPRLMFGRSRNSPIYQYMANELNKTLKHRSLTGPDVKSKIGNLVTEYRRKKKEQGRTGASPPTWPYYDSIDKLLGERPYNDDSLLSDSMKTEHQQLLEEIDNINIPDLNSTQIAEPVNDIVPSMPDIEETNSCIDVNSSQLDSSSNVDPVEAAPNQRKKSREKRNGCPR